LFMLLSLRSAFGSLFLLMIPRHPKSTLFPYTTLFRSLGVLLLTTFAGSASAQSFGKNKVHYEQLEWSVLETPHLRLHFYTEEERSEEHTSELQSRSDLVCRLLLEKKKSRTSSTAYAQP